MSKALREFKAAISKTSVSDYFRYFIERITSLDKQVSSNADEGGNLKVGKSKEMSKEAADLEAAAVILALPKATCRAGTVSLSPGFNKDKLIG